MNCDSLRDMRSARQGRRQTRNHAALQDVMRRSPPTDRSLGWLENQGSHCAWPATMVDSNSVRCFYARAVDLDTDGKAEVIASEDDHAGRGGSLHLYTCSGDPGNADDWRRYDLVSFAPGCGISVFTFKDMDRDGNLAVAVAAAASNVFLLYLNQRLPEVATAAFGD
jgi:hypothetical protein